MFKKHEATGMFAMTPISQDQILSLKKGLEVREKRAMKRLFCAVDAPKGPPGHGSARVIAFRRVSATEGAPRGVPADVICLAEKHKALADRDISRGHS